MGSGEPPDANQEENDWWAAGRSFYGEIVMEELKLTEDEQETLDAMAEMLNPRYCGPQTKSPLSWLCSLTTEIRTCIRTLWKTGSIRPRSCWNILTINGTPEDLLSFKTQAAGYPPWKQRFPGQEPEVLNFHSLVPLPAELLTTNYEPSAEDWERRNWGSSSAAEDPTISKIYWGCIEYAFHTKSKPPLELLRRVSERWPTLCFRLAYRYEVRYRDAEVRAGKLKLG